MGKALDPAHTEPTVDSAGCVEDPRLRTLGALWRDLPVGALGVPGRAAFDPLDVPRRTLPYLFVLDATESRPRYRFRLIGTGIAGLTGRDLTGRPLDSHAYGDFTDLAHRLLDGVAETRRPLGVRTRTMWLRDRAWMMAEMLFLPLATADGRIGRILGGYVQAPSARHAGISPRGNAMRDIVVIPQPLG